MRKSRAQSPSPPQLRPGHWELTGSSGGPAPPSKCSGGGSTWPPGCCLGTWAWGLWLPGAGRTGPVHPKCCRQTLGSRDPLDAVGGAGGGAPGSGRVKPPDVAPGLSAAVQAAALLACHEGQQRKSRFPSVAGLLNKSGIWRQITEPGWIEAVRHVNRRITHSGRRSLSPPQKTKEHASLPAMMPCRWCIFNAWGEMVLQVCTSGQGTGAMVLGSAPTGEPVWVRV